MVSYSSSSHKDRESFLTFIVPEHLIKPSKSTRRLSANFFDVADRHLKDKTDAISHIIRNISEQCQAAVEGLQLAQDAEIGGSARPSRRQSRVSVAQSDDSHSATNSDIGDDSHLHPSGRPSSIPPTPDLIPNRSSTSMSIASTITTPERSSLQYNLHSVHNDIPTKIVEDEDEYAERSEAEAAHEPGVVGKHSAGLMHRPAGARISALGGTR